MRTSGPEPSRNMLQCMSRRHDGEPVPAPVAPGLRLCATCRDHVEAELVDLPVLFEVCADMLDPRPHWIRERVSGNAPHGIVLRDAVVKVRSEILGVLASWCGLVAGERGVTGPDVLDIRTLARFLAVHVQWLCAHPAAPDLVNELTDLAKAVDEALRPSGGFRVTVGSCPRPGCGRPVHAEAHREGGEPYEVCCEAGHLWTPDQWLLLWGQQAGGARDRGSSPSSAESAE